jgi:hypothetical protein
MKNDIREDTEIVHLKLRLPERLRKKLADAAEASGRSMNTEIAARLFETFSRTWTEYKADQDRRKQEQAQQELLQKLLADQGTMKTLLEALQKMQAAKP